MWAWRFCYWITYEENDRHAACVPNVSACAAGRSPKQTAESEPLVQLWVTGGGEGCCFSPSQTNGSVCCHAHVRKGRKQREHERDHAVKRCLIELCVFSQWPQGGGGGGWGGRQGMWGSHCGQPLTSSTPSFSRILHTHSTAASTSTSVKKQKMGWPWAAAGARCWGVSALRWSPCFYGSPSGSPSSVWRAAWERVLSTFITFKFIFPVDKH